MKEPTINDLIDDIIYYLKREPDTQDTIKEGLFKIVQKLKDANKWKKK